MAASSPAISNNSPTTTPSLSPVSISTPATITSTLSTINASRNLRGLNKPKCIKCGNVARSRCPYQSCKNCCAKAQNPCHIHGMQALDSQVEVKNGNSHRSSSLRQLSSNFAQFSNLQSPLRSRKPLTIKDAAAINEWRFQKLDEYKKENIEVENEAFDRYILNVSLLEEVLAGPEGGRTGDGSRISKPNPDSVVVSGLKSKLRSNPVRSVKLRKRLEEIVNQGLRKLRKIDSEDELVGKQENGKYSGLNDLLDKLNKARTQEDLNSCLEIKSQLFNRHKTTSQMDVEDIEGSKETTSETNFLQCDYAPPKWFCTATIDQDVLNSIDIHFSSLEEIKPL